MKFFEKTPIPPNPHEKMAESLAERVGTNIPSDIRVALWSLPILEKIVERIEAIEAHLDSHPS